VEQGEEFEPDVAGGIDALGFGEISFQAYPDIFVAAIL